MRGTANQFREEVAVIVPEITFGLLSRDPNGSCQEVSLKLYGRGGWGATLSRGAQVVHYGKALQTEG